MSALRAVRPPAHETLFPDHTIVEPHVTAVIDALHAEISFAAGVEAALRCPTLDGEFVDGVKELMVAHIERLRAIGRSLEQQVRS